MEWQYLIIAIISISAALIAVHVDHCLSRRYEYRKARSSVKDEIANNISLCDTTCKLIDTDLDAWKADKMKVEPYQSFRELAWSTYKSVILLRNSELANKIEGAYFHIPIANNYLRRTEEFKWGLGIAVRSLKAAQRDNLDEAKHYISQILLPRLKEAKELLEKESEGWLRRLF